MSDASHIASPASPGPRLQACPKPYELGLWTCKHGMKKGVMLLTRIGHLNHSVEACQEPETCTRKKYGGWIDFYMSGISGG